MSAAAWFDEEQQPGRRAKERDRDEDVIDLEPTQMIRHVDEDIAGLAALAREVPRELDKMRESAREIGGRLGRILDKNPRSEGTAAYYRWQAKNKDGTRSVIEGPTVGMMRELGGAWGGLICSVRRLSERGQTVTLRGRVLDVARIFAMERDYEGWLRPPPPSFAGEDAGRWKTMQMQSAESKALRGVLEDIVPAWIVEEAMEAAYDAAAEARLGGRSLDEGVRKSIEALGKVGLTDVSQIERWVGRVAAQWTALDLGALRDVYARAKRGELPPDGLRVEAAQREEARKAEEAAEGGESPAAGGRLDGLGLGKGQGAQGTDSGTGGGSPAGGAAGSGTGTSGGSPASDKPPPKKHTPESNAIALREVVGPKLAAGDFVTGDDVAVAIRTKTGQSRVEKPTRKAAIDHGAALGWWRAIPQKKDGSDEVADWGVGPAAVAPAGPVVPDPWVDDDGSPLPVGLELEELCRQVADGVGVDATKKALGWAGIPKIDGAPDPALKRLLAALDFEKRALEAEGGR